MAVTRTLAAPKSRLVTGGAAPVSPRLAPARAAAIPTTSRLSGGSRLIAPRTTGGTAKLPKLRPLSEVMATAKPKEKPRSLLEQATHLVTGVPRGIIQLGTNALTDAVAPVHAAIDLVKDGKLRNIRTYLPATSGFVESMAHTGYRALHPTQYLKAIREGRIVDAIAEDVGNISIVAGGAAKALGAAGGATAVGLTAEEAGAAVGKGGSVVRSVGSAVAEDLAEGAGRVRAPINPLENVAEAVRLRPPEALYDVKMPHRGIARYFEKAGDIEGAEQLQRAGQAIKKYGHKPAQIFDPTLPFRLPGKLLDKVGYGEYAPTRLAGSALRAAGERFIPDDVKFRATEQGQKLSQILTGVHRAGIEAGSHAIDSAKQAEHYGLTTAQGRAIGLVLERPGWLDSIRDLRELPDGDHRIAAILDNSPVWRDADSVRRPTVADVQMAWDYADGNLPDDIKGKMDLVRDSMSRQAELRTGAGLEEGAFKPEQLEAELLPSKLNMERANLERQAERIDRNRNDLAPSIERQQRITATQQALADELPPPPDAGQNFNLGRASAGDATQRAAFEENQRAMRRAVDRYVELDNGAQTEALAAAAADLDRLIERHGQLSEQLGVQQRRLDAATGLSRAGYDVIPGEEVARPESAQPGAGEAKSIRARAEEIAARNADDAYAQIENLTGGNRMSLPDKKNRFQGGEYDWWNELDAETQNRLQREGWMKGRTKTTRVRRTDPRTGRTKWAKVTLDEKPTITTPDQFALSMSERHGRPFAPHEAAAAFIEQVRRYWEAEQSHAHDSTLQQVATETGHPVENVRAAVRGKISDYGELFTGNVNRTIDELKGDYDALPQGERDSFNLSAEAMRLDPEATPADFEDLLQSYFPGSDISGSQGVMSVIADNVDIPQMIDWLRGAELPETIRQRIDQRSSAQYRQLGRLQGDVNQSRAQLADVNQAQRQGRRVLNAAQRDVDKGLSAAAKDIDTLDARGAKLKPYEGEGPRLGELTPNGDPAWKRRTGTTNTGETTNPLSPAERQQAKAAVEQRNLAEIQARDARLERSAQRVRAKIDNLETELNRSIQDRVVEDVNRPAIVRVRKVVRKMGDELGGITGRGPAITLTGLTNRLARKYGFYDDALSILEGSRRDARGGMAAVDDTGGSPMPELPASSVNAVIEQIIEAKQIVMEPGDRQALANSLFTDTLLEDMAQVLYEENSAGRRLNAPYRVLDLVEQQRAHLPPEIRVQLDDAVEMWRRRRTNMLTRTFDTHTAAMPAKYRTVAQDNRGLVSSLADLAEEAHKEGDTQTASMYQAMAEDTMTTMEQFVEAGIDPTHLIGGKEAGRVGPSTIGGGPRLNQRKLRASVARRGATRPLSIGDYARLEADQAQALINNRRNRLIEDTLGVEAQAIPEVRQAMNDWETVHGGLELPPEDMLKYARDAGYAPIESRANLTSTSKLVPKEVLANLPDSFQPNAGWRLLGKANQKWKSWVLPFSPKWQLGNVVGNMIMATVHGGIGPVELARTMREIVKDQGGLREMWQREGVPDWARRELAERGFTYNEHRILNQGTEQAARTPIGKVAAMSYKVNEFVDNMTRSAVDLSKIRQGMSSEAALKSTLKAMGDFSNLNNFERNYVRQVLPFYAWMRHSVGATLRLPIQSPARAAVLLHLAQMYSDPEMSNDLLGRIGSKIPLGPVEGIAKFMDFGTLSPLAEMNPTSGFPLDPLSLARSVTPMIKLPTAILTGLDMNTMNQLKRPADAGTGPPIRKLLSDPLHGAGEIAYLAAGMAPAPIRALRELSPLSTTRGGPRYKLGYKVGGNLPADPNSDLLGTIARGLNIPWTYKIRTDQKEGG